jgi:hypothetical protein
VDKIKIIATLKWVYDLLREDGHYEALDDVEDCIVQLRMDKWDGLTDEEIDYIFGLAYADDMELLRTIEAKLKEKNGD